MSHVSKNTGYFESFDGTKLYYEERGKGSPLVLCYGIGCLFNHWRPQINHFAKTHRVIVFDYRAHHKSESPKEDHFTLEYFAHDINALMKHLKLEKATFFGHSFGAQVLVKAYDLFPNYFERIIFINGFVKNPIKGMFGGDLSEKGFYFIKKWYQLLPETMTYIWKFLTDNPVAIPLSGLAGGFNLMLTQYKDIEIYARAISSLDLEAFLKIFEQMMEYDGTPVLNRIDVPCLLIAGAKDAVTPVRHQNEMHDSIKNSEITIMPYGSHCTQLDLPDYVNIRIEKFLNDTSSQKKRSDIKSDLNSPIG